MSRASSLTASGPPACATAWEGRGCAKPGARSSLRRCFWFRHSCCCCPGIGPAVELAAHGIPVVHELPGVGKNLQDHLDFIMGWTSKDADMMGIGLRGLPGLSAASAALAQGWRRHDRHPLSRRAAPSSNPTRPSIGLTCSCTSASPSSMIMDASCIWATAFPAMSACCGRSRAARSGFDARPAGATAHRSAISVRRTRRRAFA